jgi:hypothetical protein
LAQIIDGAALHFAGDPTPPANVGQDADAKGGGKAKRPRRIVAKGEAQKKINDFLKENKAEISRLTANPNDSKLIDELREKYSANRIAGTIHVSVASVTANEEWLNKIGRLIASRIADRLIDGRGIDENF